MRTGELMLNSVDLNGRKGLGEALFENGYWFQNVNENNITHQPNTTFVDKITPNEKELTLNALEDFVVKKTETKRIEEKKISFKGGEIRLNKSDDSLKLLKLKYNADHERIKADILADKNDQIDFLFLGDNYSSESDQEDLLNNMITAMKLSPLEYIRLPFEDKDTESDEFKRVVNVIHFKHPRFVISLGAISTNILLGQKERLSRVHGKIFSRSIEFKDKSQNTILFMPIFHPDYLKINPNMKRSAWIDLQKAMEQIASL